MANDQANDDFAHAYIRQGQYSSTVCMPVSLADRHEKIKLQLQVIENTILRCTVCLTVNSHLFFLWVIGCRPGIEIPEHFECRNFGDSR